MTNPNQALIQQAHEAFARRDLSAIRAHFADGICWHVTGKGPLAGDYEGADQVIGLLGKIAELSGGTAKMELHDVLSSEAHTVSLVTLSAQRGGKQYQGSLVQVMHTENGKITEVWTHAADPYAAEEFWS